jgi:uncharacterized protein DUF6152
MRFWSMMFVLAFSPALDAHHAISAIYDNSKPITLQGTVVEFHFVNPHPFLTIDVVDDRGINRGSSRWTIGSSSSTWG